MGLSTGGKLGKDNQRTCNHSHEAMENCPELSKKCTAVLIDATPGTSQKKSGCGMLTFGRSSTPEIRDQ